MSFLSFCFASNTPDSKIATGETPTGVGEVGVCVGLMKALFSLTKGPGKGQPNKTENFQALTALLQPNITEKTVTSSSLHASKGHVGHFHPGDTWKQASQHPTGLVWEKAT